MDQVALIDIIGADPAHHELVDQRPHHGQIVIDPFQKDALISERYSVVDQAFQSGLHLRGQLCQGVGHPGDLVDRDQSGTGRGCRQ